MFLREQTWKKDGTPVGKKDNEKKAEIDINTAKECSVTGEEGERFEEMFISFVPGYSLRTP